MELLTETVQSLSRLNCNLKRVYQYLQVFPHIFFLCDMKCADSTTTAIKGPVKTAQWISDLHQRRKK